MTQMGFICRYYQKLIKSFFKIQPKNNLNKQKGPILNGKIDLSKKDNMAKGNMGKTYHLDGFFFHHESALRE